ncbi:MAG: hypothetical protein FJY82_08005 [Candidatus Aminicenantes bacterium]|nr:hypothetical protein [Candidatus Aminicenantes bacterium]
MRTDAKRALLRAMVLTGLSVLAAGRVLADPPPDRPRFTLKVSGGAGYAGLGDLARGLEGQRLYLQDEYGQMEGSLEPPTLGMLVRGELIYALNSRLAVGLGLGYLRHAKAGEVSYGFGDIGIRERFDPRLTVVPVELNLRLSLPLSRRAVLGFFAGPGFYLALLDYEYRMDIKLGAFSGSDIYTFKSRRGAAGVQGGVGIELALGPRTAVVIEAVGRYARPADFQGDWTEIGEGDFWNYRDAGSGDAMWYYAWSLGGKTYGQIAFQAERPFGILVADVRPARIDLTGFGLLLGLKFGLF